MEAAYNCISMFNDVFHFAISNPVCAASVISFALIGLLHLYCRLTLGTCDCDQDMTGKTVLITGATAGIGRVTALELARRNARVLLACRNLQKAQKVSNEIQLATGNKDVHVKLLDLCSFESVRKCAQNVLETEEKLDILINNAGTIETSREISEDGCEKIMQSNHLGHFLLTLLLIDILKHSSPSRIINVSSYAYILSKWDLDDLNNERRLSPMVTYSNSKLANILFTKELSTRLSGTGVTVNALHPGFVKTDLLHNYDFLYTLWMKMQLFLFGKTTEEGAQTTIHLALSPELEKTTGKFFSDCKEVSVAAKYVDDAMAKRLFEKSEKIVGISFIKS